MNDDDKSFRRVMNDDKTLRREIRRVVREAVRESGLTAEQLAGLAPCSPNTVSRINRLENVTIDTIDRLLAAAGLQARITVERRADKSV